MSPSSAGLLRRPKLTSPFLSIILDDVRAKAAVGAPVSIVDVWGRALAMHFYNQTTEQNFFDTSDPHNQGLLWSSIRYTQNFQNRAMPMPLVVATSRISEANQVSGNSSTVIPLANTQFEFTPYTLGSYDHTLLAQIPLTSAVSHLSLGLDSRPNGCLEFGADLSRLCRVPSSTTALPPTLRPV